MTDPARLPAEPAPSPSPSPSPSPDQGVAVWHGNGTTVPEKYLSVEMGDDQSALIARTADFVSWFGSSIPGDAFVYAAGMGLPRRRHAQMALDRIQRAHDEGHLIYVQKRTPPPPNGPGVFHYLVIRRRRTMPQQRYIERMPK